MRFCLVITTINVPTLLHGYADNFERHGHTGEIRIIVIPDRKTPAAAANVVADLQRRGFDARYVTLEEQERWLAKFPRLREVIPYDSDNRRNIGYLMASEEGADVIISVDDDNFVGEEDWLAGHAVVGQVRRLETAAVASGWFNPCSMIEFDPPYTIYARGFPYANRQGLLRESFSVTEGRVVMNGGLWLNEPDVDSVTRLSVPARGIRPRRDRLMLAPGTWAPVNTQNTAFHRDVLPAFYFVPMGDRIGGLVVERYGDIWAGYFARKVIDHMGDRVTFGAPVSDHRRNAHDLMRDLEREFWAILLNEPLVQALRQWTLTAKSYGDAYLELADYLEAAEWPTLPLQDEVRRFWRKIARAMRVWVETCRRIA